MSRSYKKEPVVKDKKNKDYWKNIRSVQNQKVRQLVYNEELEIPDAKTIINDWSYIDWTSRAEKGDSYYEKFKRK